MKSATAWTTALAIGVDMAREPAALLVAMLLERDERTSYVPGGTVNRVRDAYAGGEQKSDPRDARVIPDQVRFGYRSLRAVRAGYESLETLRIHVAYRRDLVGAQTCRVNRLEALLSEVSPGLEAVLKLDRGADLLRSIPVRKEPVTLTIRFPRGNRRRGGPRARVLPGNGRRRSLRLRRRVGRSPTLIRPTGRSATSSRVLLWSSARPS